MNDVLDQPVAAGRAVPPANYDLVATRHETRDGQPVTVRRYQPPGVPHDGARFVVVATADASQTVLSIRHLRPFEGELPGRREAARVAAGVWAELDPELAGSLSPLRTESQVRTCGVEFPVLWLKCASVDGTFAWVTVGPGGAVVEVEHSVRWDYARSRRATEMWDLDEWVAARERRGPQLPPPAALA